MKHTLYLLIVTILLFSPLRLDAVPADRDDTLELFALVAAAAQGNYENLETWRGTAFVTEEAFVSGTTEEPAVEIRQIEFIADLKNDMLINHTIVNDRISRSAMMVEDRFFRIDRDVLDDQRRRLSIQPAVVERQRRVLGTDFIRPESYFFTPDRLHPGEMFAGFRDNIETIGPFTISRDGNLITLTFRSDTGSYNRYVMDLDRGGNLVAFGLRSVRAQGADTELDITIEYETVNGVIVPSEWHSVLTMTNDDEIVGYRSITVELIHDEVNTPIAEDDFSLEALGVRPGDLIYDAETGRGILDSSQLNVEPTHARLFD